MATLAKKDIHLLETYLQMGGGHLLDFSHKTLAEFFEGYGIDIDEDQYQVGSGSKANRMRGFWKVSGDMIVGRVLKGLIAYYDDKLSYGLYNDTSGYSNERRNKCFKIANQLIQGTYSAHLDAQQNDTKTIRNAPLSWRPSTQQTNKRPTQAPVRQDFQQPEPTEQPINPADKDSKQKVFIVHGHDDNLRMDVELLVRTVGLKPIVLMDQANGGNTIIQKIQEYGEVDYAIVLYTPCDEGRKKGSQDLEDRARQNVVFEHGYFIGRLGCNKVASLYKPDVELPNDMAGVVYIKTNSDWKTQLLREFKKAGLRFDANEIFA